MLRPSSSSSSSEDEWLKKAIDQLKSGIPFFVRYVGKIELPRSIAEEPDPDNRVLIVSGCLRKVAHAASIIDESLEIPDIAERFLKDAKIITKNVETQLSIYDNVFTIGDTNKFHGRHKIGDIAFAHLDPETRDVFGYYALERKAGKPDARFYYVIQSECGMQVLAAMKLAFTVYAEKQQQQDSSGDVDVFKIAESMTPSPSTPSGAYCLLRLSTPSSDGTGFIHQVTPIDSERLHQQVRIMALSDRLETHMLQSNLTNPATSIQNITNIYFNMDDLRRINPFETNQMYPGVSAIPETLKPKKPTIQKVFEVPEFLERHENDDIGYGFDEDDVGRYATLPPVPPKSGRVLARQRQIHDEIIRMYAAPPPPMQNFYAPPPAPLPAPPPQLRHPDARSPRREETFDNEIERLKRKERDLQERIRQAEIENQKLQQQPEIPPLPPRRKRRVKFRSIKEAFQFRAQKMVLPFKKRFGNLRLSDYDESVLASEYTSLNSQSFDGSISTSASSASDASSQDSGVHDDLFVFPEAPENALHWTNRLFRKEKKVHLSREQFTQISEYLEEQPWFHGTIHRMLAESRLVKSGEFLLRQSSFQPGQFIISVLRNRTPHHICLVNQYGQIRSHAGEFSSIMHLIQFHFTTSTPLCSKSSAVLLRIPVPRPKFTPKVTY